MKIMKVICKKNFTKEVYPSILKKFIKNKWYEIPDYYNQEYNDINTFVHINTALFCTHILKEEEKNEILSDGTVSGENPFFINNSFYTEQQYKQLRKLKIQKINESNL